MESNEENGEPTGKRTVHDRSLQELQKSTHVHKKPLLQFSKGKDNLQIGSGTQASRRQSTLERFSVSRSNSGGDTPNREQTKIHWHL